MLIETTMTHEHCKNKLGSILIKKITLDQLEQKKYGYKYTIVWSDNILQQNISKNNRMVNNLPSDTYSFYIYGNQNVSEPYYITINKYDELQIKTITIDSDFVSDISIKCQITGGLSPYIAYYGKRRVISEDGNIFFNNIEQISDSYITIIDSNNCKIKSEKIDIKRKKIHAQIKSLKGASINDSHAEEFVINVLDDVGSCHTFNIYDAIDDQKDKLLKTISHKDVHKNILYDKTVEYNINQYIYPGQYIIDVVNEYGHTATIPTINVHNIEPPSINIFCKNDTMRNDQTYNKDIFIYDTILIPYILLLQDDDIYKWITKLNDHKDIPIVMNNIEHKSILLKTSPYSYIDNNILKILYIDQDPNFWFIKLDIAKGFDFKQYGDMSSSVFHTIINKKKYPISLGFTKQNNICLVRSKIISNDLNPMIMTENTNVEFFDISTQENISERYCYVKHYPNLYMPGSCAVIDPFWDTNNFLVCDIDNPKKLIEEISLTQENIFTASTNRKFLSEINKTDKNIVFKEAPTSLKSGAITIRHNKPFDNSSITYFKYLAKDKKLSRLIYNGDNFNGTNINNLTDGVYVIKIQHPKNIKCKLLNNHSYDEHYATSVSYIVNTLNMDTKLLNYEYGDILIILYKEPRFDNLPGLSYNNTDNIHTIQKVAKNNIDTAISQGHQLKIIPNYKIEYTIYGPNNFVMETSGNTVLNNLESGVYKIVPKEESLKNKYLYNDQNKEIFIDQNSKKSVLLNFRSYQNQFITQT